MNKLYNRPPSTGGACRLFSPRLLKDFPLEAFESMDHGYGWKTDFLTLPTGEWTVTQATAGTFALGDAARGVALLDCDSSTVAQGANVQLGGTAGETILPAAGKIIIVSARLKFVDTASGPEFFFGLHETDTSIIAASALSGSNYVGFSSITDDKVLLACGAKAAAADTNTGTTMVEDTYALLEMKIIGVTKVEFFVDGVYLGSASDLATANIPIVEIRPSFVCQSDGAVDTIVHIDTFGFWVYDPVV